MLSQEIFNACRLTTLTRNVVVKMDGSMNSIRKSLRKTIIESRNSDSQVAWTGGNADKYRSGTQNYIKEVFIGLNKLLDNNADALQRFQREAWKIHQEAVRAETLIFNLREELTFLRRQRNGSLGISESIQNGIQQTSRQLADLQNRWNMLVARNVALLKTESGKIRHLAGAILEMPSISSDLSLTTPVANITTETSSNNLNKRTLEARQKLQTNIDWIDGDYQNDYDTEWFTNKRTASGSWRFGKGESTWYSQTERDRNKVGKDVLDQITADKLGLKALKQYVMGDDFKNLPCCAQRLIEGTFGLYGNPYPDVEENKIKGSKKDHVPNDEDVTQMNCSQFVKSAADSAGLEGIAGDSYAIGTKSITQMDTWRGDAETDSSGELTRQGLVALVRPGMIITRYISHVNDATGHTAIIVGVTKSRTYLIAQADGRGGVTSIQEMNLDELYLNFHADINLTDARYRHTGKNRGPVLWDPAIACEAKPGMAKRRMEC